jgi:hypothetical protein
LITIVQRIPEPEQYELESEYIKHQFECYGGGSRIGAHCFRNFFHLDSKTWDSGGGAVEYSPRIEFGKCEAPIICSALAIIVQQAVPVLSRDSQRQGRGHAASLDTP